VTINIFPHQCNYARVARRCRVAFEVQQNGQKSFRALPKASTTSQTEHLRNADLEKGGQHATITASINPIWAMSAISRVSRACATLMPNLLRSDLVPAAALGEYLQQIERLRAL